MLIDFGKAGWIEKARKQPEKVKQVLDKIRTDGLLPTVDAVFNKLDEPLPLGYCNAGVVLKVGKGIMDMQPGDRVASNGQHAEMVCVPRNLCAKIPDEVADEEAAFTALGSIALQGVRLAAPSLGERVMVFGLGLVGLLTVQLLRASGCQVLAVDFSEVRLREADAFGATFVNLGAGADPVSAALAWSGGRGVDVVIIAASAKGDDILHQAAMACRKRGRIILVGVVDLNLRRNDFYEKEITFQVSCSYGPGRYDKKYEQGGQDYPVGFVRWTEQRNFEAVLEAMRAGQLRVKEMVTHRIPFADAPNAYGTILSDPAALGIILEYQQNVDRTPTINIVGLKAKGGSPQDDIKLDSRLRGNDRKENGNDRKKDGKCVVALIGAGNFSKMTLAPALAKTSARLMYVAVRTNGAAAAHIARKYGFDYTTTDLGAILADGKINTAFIATNHNSHPSLVCKSLAAGKHVFVEKPLAIDIDGLTQVIDAVALHSEQHLMVGFNRRFSPHTAKIRELLAGRTEPLTMSMTVNAGFITPDHWTQDPEQGGGRIIGEGCHFIDLLSFLAGAPVETVSAQMVGGNGPVREDKMSMLLGFADGSVGTVHYFANGSKSYPKETLEIFGDGRVIRMENFRLTAGFGFKGFRSFRTWWQDKGHRAAIAAFVERVSSGGAPLIPFEEIVNVTKTSFAAVESARTGKVISV
jgi:predicted dehydrogenase/threonine dehydrogenase-like Zn-dependent dehydrogenase